MKQIFDFLKEAGPWAIIGVFLFFVLRPLIPEVKDWIRSRIPARTVKISHEKKLDDIGEGLIQVKNHQYHELIAVLGEIKDEVRGSGERIENKLDKLNDNVIWIKSKTNGQR